MGSRGSQYERELRGVLQGEDEWIRKTTKGVGPAESAGYWSAAKKPFLVVRGAGSLGVDLVALRGDVSFPIEVKSATHHTLHFSQGNGMNQKQAVDMAAACATAGIIPLYAYRLKGVRGGDAWRIFSLPNDHLDGRLRLLYDRIPKPEEGPSGAFILRWESGLPLHRFLDYLCTG